MGFAFCCPRVLSAQKGGAGTPVGVRLTQNSGDTIGTLHGPVSHSGSVLDFLERTALDAQVSSDQIRSIASSTDTKGDYPASQLGNSLKLVAKLIGGGLPTRIFYVSQGGYDTHTNQIGAHPRLLKDLGDAVKGFVDDMKAQGNMSRVLIMTFSEFGRRVAENASSGTDHGAAAPLLLIGDPVQGGLYGAEPSLTTLDNTGNLKYSVDFRSVYQEILSGHLGADAGKILGSSYDRVSFLKAPVAV